MTWDMKNVIYRRFIADPKPRPNATLFEQEIVVTKEVNGFAVFVRSIVDGESGNRELKSWHWNAETALEEAVELARKGKNA